MSPGTATTPSREAPGRRHHQTASDHLPASDGHLDGRGTTTIADRVVDWIAEQAVIGVDAAGGSARRVLGVPLGNDAGAARPTVASHVDGRIVTVDVELSVTYPAPVGRTTAAVRDRITHRVRHMTGLEVRQVDITVVSLVTPPSPGRRVA